VSGGEGAKPRSSALQALVATLAIQVYVAFVASAPPVLAPILAEDLGIPPSLIGVFVGLLYAGSMLGSLGGGEFVARFGAIRVSQAAVIICVAGLAMMALVPAAAVALLVVAAVLLGVGYGPITAASSELLWRTTPPDRMALTFSIKQTGVPAGAALAGAVLPALALAVGWRTSFLIIAALGFAVAAAAEPTRRALDLRNPGRNVLSVGAILAPLKLILRTPNLRELAITGCAFSAVQTCLTTFLVVFLTDTAGWSVVAAGLALTCTAVAAVPGRMIWGAIADRTRAATRVLAVVGGIACVCGIALALSGPGWPTVLLLVVAAAYGATAIGWNGVQISEVARRAPAGNTASVIGASGFVTFSGVMAGPLLFAAIVGATGGYRLAFLACALVSGLGTAFLLRR
jgi:MFS family permease